MKFGAAIKKAIKCYHVIYDKGEKKKGGGATTQTSLDHFLKRIDRIESRKEPEPLPSTSGLSETAACLQPPIADDP